MMTKHSILFYLLLCLSLFACSAMDDDDDDVVERVAVGQPLPAFTVTTTLADGTTGQFDSRRLTGRTVVVLFHTTCSDCQRELPLLNAYYEQHRGEEGFQLVCISRAEGPESVAAFWQQQGLVMPYSAQPDRNVYNLFASAVIPRVYMSGADGIVSHIAIENIDWEAFPQ